MNKTLEAHNKLLQFQWHAERSYQGTLASVFFFCGRNKKKALPCGEGWERSHIAYKE